jgi:hypothetical protein
LVNDFSFSASIPALSFATIYLLSSIIFLTCRH